MADTDDALKHFMNSNDDPYVLLDLPNGSASTEKDIRSAWKKTALIYHPDKLRAKDKNLDEATANQQYILRQEAYGILSEPHLREQYDNALRAKEQKRLRDEAVTGERRRMKDELERRENAGKRKRTEEDEYEREVERLRQDGRRRRMERAEKLRKEAEEEERERVRESEEGPKVNGDREGSDQLKKQSGVQDIDRVVKLRFPQNQDTAHLTQSRIQELFSRFGPIDAVTLQDKKMKVDGEKHRRPFILVTVFYQTLLAAHAAISDFPEVAKKEGGDWKLVEPPSWASGKEPECIPKAGPTATANGSHTSGTPTPPAPAPSNPPNGSVSGTGGIDDILMIRLKNAEKARREAKAKREAEQAAANGVANGDAAASEPVRKGPTFGSFKGGKASKGAGEEKDVESKREDERRRLEEEMRRQEAEEDEGGG